MQHASQKQASLFHAVIGSSCRAAPFESAEIAGTAATDARGELVGCTEAEKELGLAIERRIDSRLRGRLRNLRVRVRDGSVILEGQCATYYTKQLAQHAALAVLEDEHLENSIVVEVAR